MLQLFDQKYASSRRFLPQNRNHTFDQLAVTTCGEHPDFFDASVDLENETWDDLSFLDFTSAHHSYYDELLERFPDFRLCMFEVQTGEMIATGMCVPLHVADDVALPHEGWDWIVSTAYGQAGCANTLAALSISVPKQYRQRGFARDMINAMRALAAMKDLSNIIAPVRPSSKCNHPFVPMNQYVNWQDQRGRIFDPWLRSHVAVGGKIVGVCERSMVVEQPLEFWSPWTQCEPDSDGPMPFQGGLVPLEVDLNKGVGRYIEPNVWVRHRA
ncbi:MAG: transferase [Hyphomicrobium sp.]